MWGWGGSAGRGGKGPPGSWLRVSPAHFPKAFSLGSGEGRSAPGKELWPADSAPPHSSLGPHCPTSGRTWGHNQQHREVSVSPRDCRARAVSLGRERLCPSPGVTEFVLIFQGLWEGSGAGGGGWSERAQATGPRRPRASCQGLRLSPIPGSLGSATGSPQQPDSLQSRAHVRHTCSHVPSQLPLLLWVSCPAATSLPKAVSLIPPHCPLSYSRPSPTSQSPVPLRVPPRLSPSSWIILPMRHVTAQIPLSSSPCLTGPILSQQAISGDVRILTTGNLESSVSVSISENLPLPMVPRLAAAWKPRGSFYPKTQLQEKMGMRSATGNDRKSRKQVHSRKPQLKGVLLSGEVDGGYLQETGASRMRAC